MLERLELHHVGPAPELVFDFARRLNLITGDNGVGKTFLLDVAWWALTRTWAGHPAAPQRGAGLAPRISFQFSQDDLNRIRLFSEYDFNRQAWNREVWPSTAHGMVLYARIDGSFSVWDSARNFWPAPSLQNGSTFVPHLAYLFNPEQVWDGLSQDSKYLCNGLIRDWASWQGRNGEPYRQLLLALDALSSSEEERLVPGDLTRVSLEDVRDMPTLRTSYGQEVPVLYASAGVRRIISLAYLLVWTWQEHLRASRLRNEDVTRSIVFLIDEAEAHLHPRWQRTILRSLLRVMEALTGTEDVQVQVLAVTHSPLLLASAEPLFDAEKDALWHLNLKDHRVVLEREEWHRRGDANSWLVSDVFELGEPRSLEAEQAIRQAESLMERRDVQPDEVSRVRDALRASLPDVDPFWVRWRFWARDVGLAR